MHCIKIRANAIERQKNSKKFQIPYIVKETNAFIASLCSNWPILSSEYMFNESNTWKYKMIEAMLPELRSTLKTKE